MLGRSYFDNKQPQFKSVWLLYLLTDRRNFKTQYVIWPGPHIRVGSSHGSNTMGSPYLIFAVRLFTVPVYEVPHFCGMAGLAVINFPVAYLMLCVPTVGPSWR